MTTIEKEATATEILLNYKELSPEKKLDFISYLESMGLLTAEDAEIVKKEISDVG